MKEAFSILMDYAIFAFYHQFNSGNCKGFRRYRDGDYQTGMNTLPIAIGIQKTKYCWCFNPNCCFTFSVLFKNKSIRIGLYHLLRFGIYYSGPLVYFGAKLSIAKKRNCMILVWF